MVDQDQNADKENPLFRVAFGVGSWKFGLKLNGPISLSVEEYCSRLSSELETISSLSDLEIVHDEDHDVIFTEKHLEDSEMGPAIFPGHTIFEINFELYIPFRIQQEIVGAYFDTDTMTEKFRIHTLPYHAPVAFVELLNGGTSHNPSTAVRVVREYLRSELNRMRRVISRLTALALPRFTPTSGSRDVILRTKITTSSSVTSPPNWDMRT